MQPSSTARETHLPGTAPSSEVGVHLQTPEHERVAVPIAGPYVLRYPSLNETARVKAGGAQQRSSRRFTSRACRGAPRRCV
eukprot:5725411-Prymnesium_polylepis.2